jgi:hypothetical protein
LRHLLRGFLRPLHLDFLKLVFQGFLRTSLSGDDFGIAFENPSGSRKCSNGPSRSMRSQCLPRSRSRSRPTCARKSFVEGTIRQRKLSLAAFELNVLPGLALKPAVVQNYPAVARRKRSEDGVFENIATFGG